MEITIFRKQKMEKMELTKDGDDNFYEKKRWKR